MLPQAVTHQLLLALVTVTALRTADAHGWIMQPASRSLMAEGEQNFYQQMSLNRPGSSKDGVCGGLYPGDPRFSVGGQFAKRTIAAAWTEGSTVEIAFQIWTNHWGKFEMRLCPLSEDSDAAESAELSDACLSQHPLTLADGSGPFYFPKGGNDVQFQIDTKWVLPQNVTCARCVLQWRWFTGHMCLPPGVNDTYAQETYMPWPVYCPSNYQDPNVLPPEKFWNCADVSITGSSGSTNSSDASQADSAQLSRKELQPASGTSGKAGAAAVTNKDGSSSICPDDPPPKGFSCSLQKAWGKCDSAWMTDGGFCKNSCGRCNDDGASQKNTSTLKANTPVTNDKASTTGQRVHLAQAQLPINVDQASTNPTPAPTAAPAMQAFSGPRANTSTKVAALWAQCGGMWGGNHCIALPDGSARCPDAPWGWIKCPSATACQRINSSYWQCRPH